MQAIGGLRTSAVADGLMRMLVAALCSLALGGLVFVALCCLAAPLFWGFELATHFSAYWLLAAIVLAVILFVAKRPKAGAGALALVVFFGWGVVPYLSLAPDLGIDGKRGTRKASVLLMNLLHSNKRYDDVETFLREADADILVLQEFKGNWARALRSLAATYPHQQIEVRNNAFGLALLSRYPLSDVEWHPEQNSPVPFVSATVDVGGQPLRLVAIHPVPPTRQRSARMRNDYLRRAADLVGGKGARMIVGDLNCTPWSPHFRRLLRDTGLSDVARGRGLKPTWYPTPLPLGIPLDHVLVSDEIGVAAREIGSDLGSDHRPVRVELSF